MGDDYSELTIPGWIEQLSRACPFAPALLGTSVAGTLDFAGLAERVAALAAEFRSYGIGRNSRVAVALTDAPETLIVLLALMSISSVLPVHPAAAELPTDALFKKVGVSAVVGGMRPASAAWHVAEARSLTYVALTADRERLGVVSMTPQRPTAPQTNPTSGLDDIALYITTSGTTGNSTVVAITQRSLDRNIYTHGLINGYGPGTRAICVMPFTYLFAYVRASLPMLRFAGAVAVAPGYRFADMQRWCESLRPTCMAATPTILQKLVSDATGARWRPRAGVLQRFHATGEAIPETLRASVSDAFGAELHTNYGMTEVSPQVAAAGHEDRFGPHAVGKIVPPWQVDILDDNGIPQPAGTVGRISLRGGYVNAIVGMPKETRYDGEGRFLTGDRGHVDEAGVLYVVGRVDDVINRGGEKIDPKVIERSLENDPDVVRAVVFGLPDPSFGQRIVGLIVLRAGATRGEQEIRAAIGARMTGWSMPERLIPVREIPMTANGKLSRSQLALRYSDALAG